MTVDGRRAGCYGVDKTCFVPCVTRCTVSCLVDSVPSHRWRDGHWNAAVSCCCMSFKFTLTRRQHCTLSVRLRLACELLATTKCVSATVMFNRSTGLSFEPAQAQGPTTAAIRNPSSYRRRGPDPGNKVSKKYNVLRTPSSPRPRDLVPAVHVVQELQSVIEVSRLSFPSNS
jgi:hypothetical protein